MRGSIIRHLQCYVAVPIAIVLLCTAVFAYTVNGTESRPELYYGNTVAGLDFIDSGYTQELFHRSTLANTDQENLAISFPEGQGGAGFAPAIAQMSSSAVAATSTGFFDSTFQFCPAINVGAPPVGVGQFMAPYPVSAAPFMGHSLMYPEMAVEGNFLAKGNASIIADQGITLPPSAATGPYNMLRGLEYLEENQSAQGFNAKEKGLPVILSSHTFDFISNPAQINNTSVLDRMWRNTHQANALNYLYEGEAARPTWIAPVTNPLLLIDCGNQFSAISEALVLTRPGKYLTRAFWTL